MYSRTVTLPMINDIFNSWGKYILIFPYSLHISTKNLSHLYEKRNWETFGENKTNTKRQ